MNKIFLILIFIFGCSVPKNDKIYNSKKNLDLNNIPIEHKIAQMIMIRSDGKFYNDEFWRKKHIENLITNYKIGGLITFSGSVHGTYNNLKSFQEKSDIPLFVAADYERGLGTFLEGTLFPSNMALAATGDTALAYKQGKITAIEANNIGVNMILAPVLDINNNSDNPIINFRSYGDTPETVMKYSIPFIKGIQDQGLIACGKHYPGHGNTATDSHTSLPIINITKNELFNNELVPFKHACQNNIKSIMIGHIVIPSIDEGLPATFSKKVTKEILYNDWNYNGLIITDALEMGALTSSTWDKESAIKSIEAGADIILLPLDGVRAIKSIINAVDEGRISHERIDQSFKKIIKYKKELGLLDDYKVKTWNDVEKNVSISKHTKVASKIAQKSITLVKNQNNVIPFIPYKYKKVTHLLLSTDSDLRTRMKPFVRDIDYIHGNVNKVYVNDPLTELGMKDIINKVENSDYIVVSMLIRISMDKGISTIDNTHSILLEKIKKLNKPVVGISFGSPYLPSYKYFDAYMCTYGYGSISLKAATDALFGRKDIEGKLPITLDNQFHQGHGIELKKKDKIFNNSINQSIDLSEPIKIIDNAISKNIFPGAQIFISKGDQILLNKGFGKLTYEPNSLDVTTSTIYDVASLTKVLSATPVAMKLYQSKKLGLDYKISDFYEEYNVNNKEKITVRHLLTHTSGLDSYVEYYKTNPELTKDGIIKDILNQPLRYDVDTKMVYSDLGMILLTDIIEKISGSKLDKLSSRYFYRPLGMKNTLFNPKNKMKNSSLNNIAPTENDTYFRNKILKGEVHDENAFLLGGVSGHAGLFSTAYDIGVFSKMLVNQGVLLGRRYLKKNVIKKFTKRINIPSGSDRTIGWDTPSQNGKSSAGDYFSKNSYGHLGFTGTSLWIDPDEKIIVVLLTNRVHPNRDNSKEMYLLRRDFHNSLMNIIKD